MSQRRQEARKAKQERRRQERRDARVEQRRARTSPAGLTASPAKTAVPVRRRRNTRLLWIVAGVAAGALVLALVGYLIWSRFKPLPGEKFTSNGNAHARAGQPHGAYFTNPPTSGWHYDDIPRPGVYTSPRHPEELGHFMEHGGVWVLYTCPEGCDDLAQQLADIVNEQIDRNNPAAVAPYPPPGYPRPEHTINVVAWRYKLSLDEFRRDTIEEFVERHACRYNPEGGPYCTGVRGASTEEKDAGEDGFNLVPATPAPSGSPPPAPTPAPATPPAAGPTPPR